MNYKIALIIILLIAVYIPTFISLAERFLATDSYYSHGFLVPLVSIYLIWRKRKRLKELLPARPSKFGLLFLAAGLFLHFISTALKINFGSYLSLPIVLAGLVLYLFGKAVTGELLFPLGFLIFMIPLPSVVIIAISFKMKIFAAEIASKLVNLMGVSAIRDGSTIYLPQGSLVVGDPCSGLRSLISLLALGAVFTQFISGPLIKKIVLFLSAIPVALISNVLRIILLLLVTYVYGEKVALGFFHNLAGMSVFVFAFIGLAIVMRFLTPLEIPTFNEKGKISNGVKMSNNKACLVAIVLLSLTLLGFIYLWQARSISPAEIKLENIPLKLGEWKGEDIPISERTYQILETKDALMREYTNSQGKKVVLAIVYSAVNRGSFHPPEICYLGGGRELLNKSFEKIEIAEPGKNLYALQVNKLLMEDRAGKEIAWYWFTAGNRVTFNYYRQQLFFLWDELRRNRAGGALVRVSTRVIKDDLEEADGRGEDFIKQIAPILLAHLPP